MYERACRHYDSLQSSRWVLLSRTPYHCLQLLKKSYSALTLHKRCHQYRRPRQFHPTQVLTNPSFNLQSQQWSVYWLIHGTGCWRGACWPSWFFDSLHSWSERQLCLLRRINRLRSFKCLSSIVDYVYIHLIDLEVFWATFGCYSLKLQLSFRS